MELRARLRDKQKKLVQLMLDRLGKMEEYKITWELQTLDVGVVSYTRRF
jgi:hypothetical protein